MTTDRDVLVKRLQAYEQADADGVMVRVSRQAVDEAIAALSQPAGEQEAVAIGEIGDDGYFFYYDIPQTKHRPPAGTKLYTTPPHPPKMRRG